MDVVPGRETLGVVGHQLPEMNMQHHLIDGNKIIQTPRRDINQREIVNFKRYTYVHIGLIIADSES